MEVNSNSRDKQIQKRGGSFPIKGRFVYVFAGRPEEDFVTTRVSQYRKASFIAVHVGNLNAEHDKLALVLCMLPLEGQQTLSPSRDRMQEYWCQHGVGRGRIRLLGSPLLIGARARTRWLSVFRAYITFLPGAIPAAFLRPEEN